MVDHCAHQSLTAVPDTPVVVACRAVARPDVVVVAVVVAAVAVVVVVAVVVACRAVAISVVVILTPYPALSSCSHPSLFDCCMYRRPAAHAAGTSSRGNCESLCC